MSSMSWRLADEFNQLHWLFAKSWWVTFGRVLVFIVNPVNDDPNSEMKTITKSQEPSRSMELRELSQASQGIWIKSCHGPSPTYSAPRISLPEGSRAFGPPMYVLWPCHRCPSAYRGPPPMTTMDHEAICGMQIIDRVWLYVIFGESWSVFEKSECFVMVKVKNR